MDIEQKLTKERERAAKAESLLQNPLLIETFAMLEAEWIKAWRETPARDTDARERLWQAVNVIALVRDQLQQVVETGKMAKRQIDQMAGRDVSLRAV